MQNKVIVTVLHLLQVLRINIASVVFSTDRAMSVYQHARSSENLSQI